MEQMKHTPGPWRLHDMEAATVVQSATGNAIADCNATRHTAAENDANARMCSAAPELASALDGTLGLIRRAQETLCSYLHPDSGIDSDELANVLLEMFDGPKQREIEAAARSALSKARTP